MEKPKYLMDRQPTQAEYDEIPACHLPPDRACLDDLTAKQISFTAAPLFVSKSMPLK